MSHTSAYQLQIRTDSCDENAIILLANGQLVAILVELADESHGDECGKWTIESTFGAHLFRVSTNFGSASEAADWVSHNICGGPFVLDGGLTRLV